MIPLAPSPHLTDLTEGSTPAPPAAAPTGPRQAAPSGHPALIPSVGPPKRAVLLGRDDDNGTLRVLVGNLGPARFLQLLASDKGGEKHRQALKAHNRGRCPTTGCRCAANPVSISGNVTEYILLGESSVRLVQNWALKQRNPADLSTDGTSQVYGDSIHAILCIVKARMVAALVSAGVPPEVAQGLQISVCSILENAVERDGALQFSDANLTERDFVPKADKCSGTPGQAPHRDGGRGTVQARRSRLADGPRRKLCSVDRHLASETTISLRSPDLLFIPFTSAFPLPPLRCLSPFLQLPFPSRSHLVPLSFLSRSRHFAGHRSPR